MELGHRLRQVSGEANSFAYLTQRLSVDVQGGGGGGGGALLLPTMKVDSEDKESFFCISSVCFMFYVFV